MGGDGLMANGIKWQRGSYPGGLPRGWELVRVILRSPDGRFKIGEKVAGSTWGYPLFDGGVHVATKRLLSEAKAEAEGRV